MYVKAREDGIRRKPFLRSAPVDELQACLRDTTYKKMKMTVAVDTDVAEGFEEVVI